MGSISRRLKIPLNNTQEVEVFDMCGNRFHGPVPLLYGNMFILVAVYYVSKWIKATTLPTNYSKVVGKIVRK